MKIFIGASWFLGYKNFTAFLFHGLNSFHLEVFQMMSREMGPTQLKAKPQVYGVFHLFDIMLPHSNLHAHERPSIY